MIVYLHGFNSAPASHKAQTMQRFLAERGLGDRFECPALPHLPADAVALIEALPALREPGQVTLVGISLGGFYATWLADQYACRAIHIPPPVYPPAGPPH